MNKKIEKIILVCLESFTTENIGAMLHEENWSAGAKRLQGGKPYEFTGRFTG